VNARAINAAAGVIHAAMRTHRTAAGIAAAVDAAGLLMSPETAAELARLRKQAETGPRIWHVFEEDTHPAVPPLFASEEAARDETIARYQEMEGHCPDYSWRQHEDGSWELLAGGEPVGIYLTRVPVTGVGEDPQALIDQLRADRNAYADRVDTLTKVAKGNKRHVKALAAELETAQARVAELEQQAAAAKGDLTVYRAQYDSIVMGLYTTAAEARAHCVAEERRSQPDGTSLVFDWIEDEEDGVAELVTVAEDGETESTTGYVVEALTVAAAYDPDGDE
jgi:hypothetical protein